MIKKLFGSPHDLVAKVQDCDIIESIFELLYILLRLLSD